MTAEQLQDALGLLPMDLIEEADALRRKPKKKPIPFRRWGALAACAVLVLGCGSGLEVERIRFACDVTGVDISSEMLKMLQQKQFQLMMKTSIFLLMAFLKV